jgi:hypothetical protein
MFVSDSDNHEIHRCHNDSGHRPYALWQQSGRVSRRTGGGQALQQDICNKRYPSGPGGKPAGGRHVNNTLRRVTMTGGVSTVAGNDEEGFTDGEGATVCFNRPNDIVVEGEVIIVVNSLQLRVSFPRLVWSHRHRLHQVIRDSCLTHGSLYSCFSRLH